MAKGTAIARFLASVLAFVANVPVGQPEVHVAFDITEGLENREFVEVFLADQHGLPTEGRRVDPGEYRAVFVGANAVLSSRLPRALQQYDIALRYWYYGGEWLSLAHLYMAVETLGPAIIARHCSDKGFDQFQLAESVGIDVKKKDWKRELSYWSRRSGIFDDDNETYGAARHASDGIEHGIYELTEVHANALAAADKTWGYVRRALLWLCNVSEDDYPQLYSRLPRDVRSFRKIVRGLFVGDGSNPAPAGADYPYLEWTSSIKTATRDSDDFRYSFVENFKVHCSTRYAFRGTGLEIRGRNEPGSEPIRLDPVIEINVGPAARSKKDELLSLLKDVGDFASQAAEPSRSLGMKSSRMHVFDVFTNQVALTEAIAALLMVGRVAEAMMLTHKTLIGTCRLELMGVDVTRTDVMAIDLRIASLERQKLVFDDDRITSALDVEIQRLRSVAATLPPLVSGGPACVEETEYYNGHKVDILFAGEVGQGEDLAARLRLVPDEAFGRVVRTIVEDEDNMTAIACSAATALLSSTKFFTAAMEWPFDVEVVSRLEARIAALGDAAAAAEAEGPAPAAEPGVLAGEGGAEE
ncbi:hypothetical protein [Luedemannella helvata]|uniref:Uncharacterized protein n=1 Tax=Luedemannella helvata TaxID=349315 RepID=A0ABN2KWT0_9ACTN